MRIKLPLYLILCVINTSIIIISSLIIATRFYNDILQANLSSALSETTLQLDLMSNRILQVKNHQHQFAMFFGQVVSRGTQLYNFDPRTQMPFAMSKSLGLIELGALTSTRATTFTRVNGSIVSYDDIPLKEHDSMYSWNKTANKIAAFYPYEMNNVKTLVDSKNRVIITTMISNDPIIYVTSYLEPFLNDYNETLISFIITSNYEAICKTTCVKAVDTILQKIKMKFPGNPQEIHFSSEADGNNVEVDVVVFNGCALVVVSPPNNQARKVYDAVKIMVAVGIAVLVIGIMASVYIGRSYRVQLKKVSKGIREGGNEVGRSVIFEVDELMIAFKRFDQSRRVPRK